MEELWKDWSWTEAYPRSAELRSYFQHVDSKLDIKKDVHFDTRVTSAHYNVQSGRWDVRSENGLNARPHFLVLCTGFAGKEYIPPWEGLERSKGVCHHTAKWPQEGVSLEGKRVTVIGTGASGLQVIQEIGPIVQHLSVFQRTPMYAFPVIQTKLDERQKLKRLYPTILRRRLQTFDGTALDAFPKDFCSASPEERRLLMEDLWSRGGYCFFSENYQDIMSNEQANEEVYRFWREKVRERIREPVKQEILAPTTPPHPFGAKRPAMEQAYYEVFNQSNVTLVDIEKVPITEITSDGILTDDGVHHEVDVIVLATGFDAITGPLSRIDIRGVDDTTLKEKWANGVYTYLGMTTANFPNMFFLFGPQSPVSLANGPTLAELQGDWLIACIEHMLDNRFTHIEASPKAEEEWRNRVLSDSSKFLFDKAKSYYTGANIPGKHVEQLNFCGGIPAYDSLCRAEAETGYRGFVFSSNK
ncbi:cyclohexanone monooxygenase [Marasmius fiardii PR-910]|nr:cyclohexanone monooxygenase [Marasmius fiardii PR-910]